MSKAPKKIAQKLASKSEPKKSARRSSAKVLSVKDLEKTSGGCTFGNKDCGC